MTWAKPTTPCLAAAYGAKNGVPFTPDVEPMQMMEPPPVAMRWGTVAEIVFHVPVRVGFHDLVPERRRHLVPGVQRADARVGDHDVKPTELDGARVHCRYDGFGIADICLPGDDATMFRLHCLGRFLAPERAAGVPLACGRTGARVSPAIHRRRW